MFSIYLENKTLTPCKQSVKGNEIKKRDAFIKEQKLHNQSMFSLKRSDILSPREIYRERCNKSPPLFNERLHQQLFRSDALENYVLKETY